MPDPGLGHAGRFVVAAGAGHVRGADLDGRGEDLVALDGLLDRRLALGRVVGVVLRDQLDLVAVDPAGGVDLVEDDLHARADLAEGGQRAGLGADEADLDRRTVGQRRAWRRPGSWSSAPGRLPRPARCWAPPDDAGASVVAAAAAVVGASVAAAAVVEADFESLPHEAASTARTAVMGRVARRPTDRVVNLLPLALDGGCSPRTRQRTCPWRTTPADGQGSPERTSTHDLSERARCRPRRRPRSGTARCTSGSWGTTRTTLALSSRNPATMPAGHEEHQHDEDEAVEHIGLGTGEHVEGQVGQELDDHAAERGADDRRDAADDEAGDQLDRSLEAEAVGSDGAAGEREAARRRPPSTSALTANAITLHAGAVDARRDGPDLVVPHGDRGPPDAAADQVRGQEEHHDGDEEDGDEDPGVVVEVAGHPRRCPPAEAVRHVALADGDGLAVAATGQALHLLDDRGEGRARCPTSPR